MLGTKIEIRRQDVKTRHITAITLTVDEDHLGLYVRDCPPWVDRIALEGVLGAGDPHAIVGDTTYILTPSYTPRCLQAA